MAYGYRESESHLIPPYIRKGSEGYFLDPKTGKKIKVDKTAHITKTYQSQNKSRPVAMASLGMHVPGLAQPHVDMSDMKTAMSGALYRFGREINHKKSRKFRRFVRNWLKNNLTPLNPSDDTSFETWIMNTPYTLARKEELRRKYDELTCGMKLPDQYLKVKSFIKDETYPTYKHARAINSRTDEFKATVGPIFQLISNKIFALDWFIKKIPINERPDYILDRLGRLTEKFRTTDYTSFEAHFTKEMKTDCEFLLYEYMVQNLPEGKQWLDLVKRSGAETDNNIFFKQFSMKINAKRMSGEMDTSLANGFSNLMFMLYICEINGNREVSGVIEGDDGLFVMKGHPPRPKLFEDFGLVIKIVDFDELNHASFCGMVFDVEDRTNVTDPIDELVSFGWTTARYSRSSDKIHKHLLRSKALSLAYQYPACPILSELAFKVCKLTSGYDTRAFLEKQGNHAFNQYELEIVQKAEEYFRKKGLDKPPGKNTRLLVEELYGITVGEQIAIESKIREIKEIQPLTFTEIYDHAPQVWADYYDRYSIDVNLEFDMDDRLALWPNVRPEARIPTGRCR